MKGFDTAYFPGTAKAIAIADTLGAEFVGVYIGGVAGVTGSANSWNQAALQSVKHRLAFLPIYTPIYGTPVADSLAVQHAQDAVQCMQARLFGAPNPICLDVESSTFDGDDIGTLVYVRDWATEVAKQGYQPGVYGTERCLAAIYRLFPGLLAFSWLAWWTSGGVQPAPANYWQYSGTTWVDGVQVDLNQGDGAMLARLP